MSRIVVPGKQPMKKAKSRGRRRDEILDVALHVLIERGYRDASTLEIAKRASASKETLYSWFGDKQGVLEALIERNARTVQGVLSRHLEADAPAERLLQEFGCALLALLLGDSAIAINRAAISEARSDPALAQILGKGGRDTVMPAFIRLLERYSEQDALRIDNAGEAAQDFLGLLLGDAQTRRLLGLAPPPRKAQVERRAQRAARSFMRLYGT